METSSQSTGKRVQNHLRQSLIEQDLEPGARLIEADICSELAVSRTPVREALFKLEQEGFVKSDRARGFTVRQLNAQEVRELYPIIWTLEILALQLSESRLKNVLPELASLNKLFSKVKNDPPKTLHLDRQFHECLTRECRNKHLLQQLQNLRDLVLRYEFAYMREGSWQHESAQQHEEIIAAIARADLQLTIHLVQENWRNGMERIANWLDWQKWQKE